MSPEPISVHQLQMSRRARNTGGGNRTHTGVPPQRILSPLGLPQASHRARVGLGPGRRLKSAITKKGERVALGQYRVGTGSICSSSGLLPRHSDRYLRCRGQPCRPAACAGPSGRSPARGASICDQRIGTHGVLGTRPWPGERSATFGLLPIRRRAERADAERHYGDSENPGDWIVPPGTSDG